MKFYYFNQFLIFKFFLIVYFYESKIFRFVILRVIEVWISGLYSKYIKLTKGQTLNPSSL